MSPPRRKSPTRPWRYEYQCADGEWHDDIQEAEFSYREITDKDTE